MMFNMIRRVFEIKGKQIPNIPINNDIHRLLFGALNISFIIEMHCMHRVTPLTLFF